MNNCIMVIKEFIKVSFIKKKINSEIHGEIMFTC